MTLLSPDGVAAHGWRQAFQVFGCLGLVWAAVFFWWFRDNPRDHKNVNAAELTLLKETQQNPAGHGKVPWAKLLQSHTVLLLWLQYFCFSYGWYFYITWLPTYLQEYRRLSPVESANLAVLPLLFGGIGSLICGFISPRVAQWTGSVRTTRRLMASLGFFGAGIMLLISIRTQDPQAAMIFMGLASFFNDLVMPGAWAACMDIGGRYAGTLAGSMNMMGNVAAFVAPMVGGMILDSTKQATGTSDWNLFLYVMAVVYLLGTIVWPFIDPVTSIDLREAH
jgi:sugar phosphate permease